MWFINVSEMKASSRTCEKSNNQCRAYLCSFYLFARSFTCSLCTGCGTKWIISVWGSSTFNMSGIGAYHSTSISTLLKFMSEQRTLAAPGAVRYEKRTLWSMYFTVVTIWLTIFLEISMRKANQNYITAHISATTLSLNPKPVSRRDAYQLNGSLSKSDLAAIKYVNTWLLIALSF